MGFRWRLIEQTFRGERTSSIVMVRVNELYGSLSALLDWY